MSCYPFRYEIGWGKVQMINGQIVSGYRIQFTTLRGISFRNFNYKNFGIGRSIVAAAARESCKHPLNLIISRAIGLLDTIQYLAFSPLLILFHVLAFVCFLIVGLITLPLLLCLYDKIKGLQLFLWVCVLTLPLTLLLNIAGLIFVPLQIIVPELVAAIQFDKWDLGDGDLDVI